MLFCTKSPPGISRRGNDLSCNYRFREEKPLQCGNYRFFFAGAGFLTAGFAAGFAAGFREVDFVAALCGDFLGAALGGGAV